MYIDIRQMVTLGNLRKNGFDYVPIAKNITREAIQHPEKTLFTQQDVEEVKAQPFIKDAAPLVANQFHIQLSAGSLLSFETDFFIETLKEDFIDTVPPTFTWQEGRKLFLSYSPRIFLKFILCSPRVNIFLRSRGSRRWVLLLLSLVMATASASNSLAG
jgi:hypothetical protein